MSGPTENEKLMERAIVDLSNSRDEWKQRHGIQEQAFIAAMQKLAEREKDLLAVERNYNIQQETIEKLKADLASAYEKLSLLMMENPTS